MGVLKFMDEDYTGFGEMNVQADWNQSDSTKDDYIKNKPAIVPLDIVKNTYSAHSNSISISRNASYRIGNICFICVRVTADTALDATLAQVLIVKENGTAKRIKTHDNWQDSLQIFSFATNNKKFVMLKNGNIANAEALPQDSISIISGAFICE